MIGASAQLTDICHHSAMSRAMADITGELWIVRLLEDYLIWFCHTILTDGAGTDDGWPSLCHDGCQFTFDGYLSSLFHETSYGGYYWWVVNCAVTRRLLNLILSHNLTDDGWPSLCHDRRQCMIDRYPSSLCHEQSYGGYLSIVDCIDHGEAMAGTVRSREDYLIWFFHRILTDGAGTDDRWWMTDDGRRVVAVSMDKVFRLPFW
jgi:hypothetical protein